MIGEWSTSLLADTCGGQCIGPQVVFTGVSTDTRTVQPGDLFLALVGENFDGHRFIEQALNKGAVAVCVSDPSAVPAGVSAWLVEDTRLALGQLGALNRSRFTGTVFAITGSAGKTTVKEMLAAMCTAHAPTLYTHGNLNNDLGAPMTLLRLEMHHEFAVIELGASAIGEIDYTVQMTQPHVAILNNAMGAHLEGFGSLAGVVKAKGEIFNTLNENGVAIINADDYHASVWLEQVGARCRVATFSVADHADATGLASGLALNRLGGYDFVAQLPSGEFPVSLKVLGRHNVANAVAALVAMDSVGVLDQTSVAALADFQAVKGRMRPHEISKHLVIDDSYNANPDAAKVAAQVLSSFSHQRLFILGDMAEVGAQEVSEHREVGRFIAQQGIEGLLAVGPLSAHALSGFIEEKAKQGIAKPLAKAFDSRDVLAEYVSEKILTSEKQEWTLLIKGSRSAKMDQVVTTLTQPKNEQ